MPTSRMTASTLSRLATDSPGNANESNKSLCMTARVRGTHWKFWEQLSCRWERRIMKATASEVSKNFSHAIVEAIRCV